jgi:hypothetical protein
MNKYFATLSSHALRVLSLFAVRRSLTSGLIAHSRPNPITTPSMQQATSYWCGTSLLCDRTIPALQEKDFPNSPTRQGEPRSGSFISTHRCLASDTIVYSRPINIPTSDMQQSHELSVRHVDRLCRTDCTSPPNHIFQAIMFHLAQPQHLFSNAYHRWTRQRSSQLTNSSG